MVVLMPEEWAPPLDLSPEAIAVVDATTLSIVHVNKQFTKQIAPVHRAVGLRFLNDLIQPGDRPLLQEAIDHAFCAITDDHEQKNTAFNTNTLIIGALCQYPVYRAYDWQFTTSSDGSLLFCWGRLMTKLDAERLKAEAEFQDFFDNAPIAMHWLGGTGSVIWANKMEMTVLGYTPEEYIGKPITDFCPDEKELVLKIFHNLGTGNSIHDVPVRFRKKDGRIQHLLIDSNVNWNMDGTFNHTRCFIRDDTERLVRETRLKMQQAQLKELSQVKESLLRKVMHEVRTPCHQIATTVEELEDLGEVAGGGRGADAMRMPLSVLRFSVQRLSDLMEDVGDTLMLQENMLNNFKESTFNLHQALNHFAASFTWFQSDRVNFSVYFNLTTSMVVGYEHGLFRVLRILLAESISKTSDGQVSITVEEDVQSHMFSFTVQDTRKTALEDATSLKRRFSVKQLWNNRSGDTNMLHEDGARLGVSGMMAKHYLQQMNSNLHACVNDASVLTVSFQLKMVPAPNQPPPTPLAEPVPSKAPQPNIYNMQKSDNYIAPELTQEALKHFAYSSSDNRKKMDLHSDDARPTLAKDARKNFPDSDTASSVDIPLSSSDETENSSSRPSGEFSGTDVSGTGSSKGDMAVGLKVHTKRSVLIVEDNKVSQMCAERVLKKMDLLTDCAEHGEEALEKLKANPFGYDLILMDIRMPIMDGLECTERIHKELKLTIPIVAFTADYSQEMRDKCAALHMEGFLSKPANTKEFKGTIMKLLNERCCGTA